MLIYQRVICLIVNPPFKDSRCAQGVPGPGAEFHQAAAQAVSGRTPGRSANFWFNADGDLSGESSFTTTLKSLNMIDCWFHGVPMVISWWLDDLWCSTAGPLDHYVDQPNRGNSPWRGAEFSFFYGNGKFIIFIPVVPHTAVAEVSKIGHYRRGELLWIKDGWRLAQVFFLPRRFFPVTVLLAIPLFRWCSPPPNWKPGRRTWGSWCFFTFRQERSHWWTERWLELCFMEWLQWLQWPPHHNCWM